MVRRDRAVLCSKPVSSGATGVPDAASASTDGSRGRSRRTGMAETFRCTDRAGSDNRLGASVLLGCSSWLVHPALRAGIQYDGDVEPTAGASLMFGRR